MYTYFLVKQYNFALENVFFCIISKSKAFRGVVSSQVGYKLGHSASFDVKTKSVRPPEPEIQKIHVIGGRVTEKGSVACLNKLFLQKNFFLLSV